MRGRDAILGSGSLLRSSSFAGLVGSGAGAGVGASVPSFAKASEGKGVGASRGDISGFGFRISGSGSPACRSGRDVIWIAAT